MKDSLFDKTFRDSDGQIAIAQMPNLPILVWVGSVLLKLIFTSGQTYLLLDTIAFGTLFTWAWEELFQGVNYFRRGLGLLVLIGVIGSRI